MKYIYAFVITLTFALCSQAQTYLGYLNENAPVVDSTGKKVLKRGLKGDGILIYTLDVHNKNYFRVHHINGKKDGFVARESILLVKSVPYMALTQEEIEQAIRDTEMKNPVLKVYNNTKGNLSLKFGNEKIELKPKERTQLVMNKGKYYYKLIMEGQQAYYGVERLEDHRLYDWEFYVGK